MSRVYFHSPARTAELRGAERAWASSVVEDMATGIVTPRSVESVDRMMNLVPDGHYLRHMRRDDPGWLPAWQSAFDTAWRVELALDWRGASLDSWLFSLNTALAMGNDQVRFLARLHGQCEMHGWVDGPNRAWLADLIEQGRALGFYRAEMGWEDVVALLRSRSDEPVVMSYSVCDSFPNADASDWMPAWPTGKPERWDALSEEEQRVWEERAEAWYDLPDDEQWERCLRWLRNHSSMLEIKPDGWSEFRFGHGLTAFDLTASDRDERLERALVGSGWSST